MTSAYPNPSRPSLWGRISRNDPDAAAELLNIVENACASLARKKDVRGADIDEVQSATVAKILKYAGQQSEAPRNLEAMIYFKAMGELSALRRGQVGFEPEEDIASDEASPEDELAGAERTRAIWSCVNELPENHRRAWEARYLEGLSVARIAEMLGVSESTIPVWFFRCKEKLRDCLRRKGVV